MVLRRCSLLLFILLFFPFRTGGGTVPADLHMLGQGEAYYLKFIKVYNATLYSNEHVEVDMILTDKVSKCLELLYAVDIDKEDFVEAANTVLQKQFSKERLATAREDIDILHQGYLDVEAGDSYTLCYDSRVAKTTLTHNGNVLVSINSPKFAQIYFSIWLGKDDPLDDELRVDLLAGAIRK